MSTQNEPKRLTSEDPLEPENLRKFAEYQMHRERLAVQLLDLETERVQVLFAARRLDEERNKLFEKVLIDRGLHPQTAVEIDPQTGVIQVVRPVAPPVTETAQAAPQAP